MRNYDCCDDQSLSQSGHTRNSYLCSTGKGVVLACIGSLHAWLMQLFLYFLLFFYIYSAVPHDEPPGSPGGFKVNLARPRALYTKRQKLAPLRHSNSANSLFQSQVEKYIRIHKIAGRKR